jgi:RNA polymerase-interacting CarD/CdnL/TRCF family regulator
MSRPESEAKARAWLHIPHATISIQINDVVNIVADYGDEVERDTLAKCISICEVKAAELLAARYSENAQVEAPMRMAVNNHLQVASAMVSTVADLIRELYDARYPVDAAAAQTVEDAIEREMRELYALGIMHEKQVRAALDRVAAVASRTHGVTR